MNLLRLDGVAAGYRRQRDLITGVGAAFEDRRTYAITGPSGCGKSTLLYIMGLMLRPRRGSVILAGVDYARRSDADRAAARARHIGFVFQDGLLDPSLTAAENVLEGISWGQPINPLRRRGVDLLERFGVAAVRDERANSLSGGEGQRVALARALIKDPPILLADEPTGNLDAATASVVIDALLAHGRRRGCTAIIVTHSRSLAERCDAQIALGRAPS